MERGTGEVSIFNDQMPNENSSLKIDTSSATLSAPMDKPNITCYLKPTCGWSEGVRSVLRKHDLTWDEKDVVNNPEHRAEMIERSGQMLQPCVEINGNMLADVSGDEVEAWLLANKVVGTTTAEADAPTDQPCAHEMPEAQSMHFKN